MREPVETKVIVGAAGAGAGAVVSAFLLWLLGCVFWGVPFDAGHASDAVAAVPEPVAGMTALLLTVAGSFLAGYAAPHTMRTEDANRLLAITLGRTPPPADEGTT